MTNSETFWFSNLSRREGRNLSSTKSAPNPLDLSHPFEMTNLETNSLIAHTKVLALIFSGTMSKRIIQDLIPAPLLKRYKKKQYVNILKSHNIDDEPDIKIAQRLVKPEGTVLDIGANIGLNAKYLSPLARKVICFEPVPFTFEMLENNLRLLKLQNVEVYQKAISNKNGIAKIEIPIHAGVYNYYRASLESQNKKSGATSVSIKTLTLDSFLDGYSAPVSFVKCDVEGHELAVLEGAS